MTLVDHIWHRCRLATLSPSRQGLGLIDDGLIAANAGRIVYAGAAANAPSALDARERTDCAGRWISPGLIDCHTHLVYGGNRAHEFEQRLAGASYEEIARAGGGIVSTVKATRQVQHRRACSGSAAPARCPDRGGRHHHRGQVRLRPRTRYRAPPVAGRPPSCRRAPDLGSNHIPWRPHRSPRDGGNKSGYIDAVCDEMLPAIAAAGLADAVDAFCEGIAFSVEQTAQVFTKAQALGLPVRLHADQFRTCMAPRSRRGSARSRPIISNMPMRTGWRRWPGPAPSPSCCRVRSISFASTSCRRSMRCAVTACRSRWRPTATRVPRR